jgi:hypothetical protein
MESFGSDVSRFFTGSPTDKAVWMLIGGIVATVVGLGQLTMRNWRFRIRTYIATNPIRGGDFIDWATDRSLVLTHWLKHQPWVNRGSL